MRKQIRRFAEDVSDRFKVMGGALIPPRELRFIGRGDFEAVGQEFLRHLRELVGLQPGHSLLDVGCGIGRIAIPLTTYLSPTGKYDGFDIVPHGIRWCADHITPKFPNFRFLLADIRNKNYNPNGGVVASEYRFPYADDSFDVIVLTSVFTHMLPREVLQYLREIRRVLKPGGRSLITWYFLNDDSRARVKAGDSRLNFRYPIEGCLTTDEATPEKAIAYPESLAGQLYADAGLIVESPIRFGGWCARDSFTSWQDICLAHRPW